MENIHIYNWIFVCSFLIMLLIFTLLIRLGTTREQSISFNLLKLATKEIPLKIAYFNSILAIALYIYSAGGITGVFRSWVSIAITRSSLELLASNISQVFFIFSLTIYFYNYITTKKLTPVLSALILGTIFMALTRSKSYLLPLVLPYAYYIYEMNRNNIFLLFFKGIGVTIVGVFFYLLTTIVRWSGNLNEINTNKISQTYESVVSTGVERNLYYQFSQIFDYFHTHNSIYMQTYMMIFNPLLKLVQLDSIRNPMYLYNDIIYGGSGAMQGSAHPTIFADSFANANIFGVVFGAIHISLLAFILSKVFIKNKFKLCSFIVISSYSIPLIVRGSVYYGILYFVILSLTNFILYKIINIRCNAKK
jgi:oligosaccharide repeat unit polymerase